MAKYIKIISYTLAVMVLILIMHLTVRAQTWLGPESAPPTNPARIPPISQLGGDNLGNHVAEFDLNMEQWSILHIQSNSTSSALQIHTYGTASGADITSVKSYGIRAQSDSSETAVWAQYAGTGVAANGFGFQARSGSTVSGRIFGLVALTADGSYPAQARIGTNPINILYAATAPSPTAVDPAEKLYWGRVLLCDASDPQKNCGFRSNQYTPDNLGLIKPHTAVQTLDLAQNRIINVGAPSTSSLAAFDVTYSGVYNPGIRASNTGTIPGGVAASILGETTSLNRGHGGLYALHQSVGPGVVAVSESGFSARIYGRLNIFGSNQEKLVFNPANATDNVLTIAQQAVDPSSGLYWGDQILCDPTQPGCGSAQSVGAGNEYWDLATYPGAIYYNRLIGSNVGFVGIGTNAPQYQLDVVGLTRTTSATFGEANISGSLAVDRSLDVNDGIINGTVTVSDPSGVASDLISVSDTGYFMIGGVRMNEGELSTMINRCRQAGVCTHIPSWP